jgi:hypothetical protein
MTTLTLLEDEKASEKAQFDKIKGSSLILTLVISDTTIQMVITNSSFCPSLNSEVNKHFFLISTNL